MSNNSADVVVVGAGVVGAATAFHLAQKGLRVAVIDIHGVASGATGSSGALIRVHHDDWNQTLLAKAGYEEFLHWNDVVGGPGGLTRTGCLHFARQAEEANLRKRINQLSGLGIKCQLLNVGELRDRYPMLHWDDNAVALLEPGAGYVDARKCTRAYLDKVIEKGGKVLTDSRVTGLRAHNGRLSELQTTSGSLATDTAIFATGAWATRSELIPGLTLPVRTKRIIAQRIALSSKAPGLPAYVDEEPDSIWFRPDGEEQVLVGGPCEEWGLDPDQPVPPADKSLLKAIRLRLEEMLPQHKVTNLLELKSGLDSYTPDQLPIIDEWPLVKGLYMAIGFSGSGFKTAPAVGSALSAWIHSGKKDTLLAPFTLKRFSEWDPANWKTGEEIATTQDTAAPKADALKEAVVKPEVAEPEVAEPEVPAKEIADEVPEPVKALVSVEPDEAPIAEDAPLKKKRRKRKKKKKGKGEAPAAQTPAINLEKPIEKPADDIEKPVDSQEQKPTGPVQIRQATENDLPALIEMVMAYIDFYEHPRPDSRSLETLLRHLQINPGAGRQFVAHADNRLVGFATLYCTFSTLGAQKIAVLNDLFVAPQCRKQGIGSELFDACRRFVKDNGYARMDWVTAPDNHAARAFYEKMGGHADSWVAYSI